MNGDLPDTIDCAECAAAFPPDGYPVSRAAVNDEHWQHRPPHPNEVGPGRRREAAKAYAAWEALSPYKPR